MNQPVKRASVSQENGKTVVRINSSAMSLMNTCQRKAKFILLEGIESKVGVAAQFGTLIHKAMERYYSLDPKDHNVDTIQAIWTEVSESWEDPEDKPHTKATGLKLLKTYANVNKNDPWVIVKDKDGKPLSEAYFEVVLNDDEERKHKEILFGTIDMIVKNTETGQVSVMDHKTGRSLGLEFMNRWKPNNQMSAYILAAQKYFGLSCNSAIINGLQVAKTVQSVCRVETWRDQSELEEFTQLVFKYTNKLHFLGGAYGAPPADGATCSQFGGCFFQQICALTPALRDTALKNLKETQIEEGAE